MARVEAVDVKPWLHKLVLALFLTVLAAYPVFFLGISAYSEVEVRITEFLGSDQPEGQRGRNPARAFDGRLNRYLATDAPDGEAYVGLKLNRPVGVQEAILHSRPVGKGAKQVTAARLQGSDDGVNWVTEGPAVRDESGRITMAGQMANEPQPHLFWRVLVEESGPSDVTVVHEVEFRFASGNSDGTRPSLWFEWSIISLLAASTVLHLFLLGYFKSRLTNFLIFSSFSLFFIVWSNYYFVVANPTIAVLSPDSFSYLNYAIHRTIGYPLFLSAVEIVLSYLWVGAVQFNIYIISCLLLSYAAFAYSRSILISVLSIVLMMINAFGLKFGLYFLTESLFISFVNLTIAAMFFYLRGQAASRAVLVGIALAFLIAVKSIGPVIAVACLVFLSIAGPPPIVHDRLLRRARRGRLPGYGRIQLCPPRRFFLFADRRCWNRGPGRSIHP